MVPDHFGLPDVQAVIEGFHYERLDAGRFSGLTPLVLQAADADDAVAGAILDRQAEEIVAFAVAALERLDLTGSAVPVVLGGGVLAAGNRRLLDGVRAGLRHRAPQTVMTLVRSRPILGAALLAMERVECTDDAMARAQRELALLD